MYTCADSVETTEEPLQFRVLGPLEARRGDEALALGGPRRRALLALLLLNAGEAVSRDRLIEGLWGERPPDTAPNALQVQVHALRRLLGTDAIETVGQGYRLRIASRALDLTRFGELVGRGRSDLERGDAAGAATAATEALALWRGEALGDLRDEPFAQLTLPRLEEERLGAIELRVDAELALGRHDALVAELQELIRDHPLRERLRRQLMLALYRSGRQAEALESYAETRRALVDELGIDPSPELQELERAILRQDESLGVAQTGSPPFGVRLPAPPTPLVGRRLELAAASTLIRDGARMLTLTGPGGTGKTRLALALAAELAPEFGDGVVFVDLAPLRDSALVGPEIARTLELGEADADALAAELRGRRLLLVLDNFEHVADAAGIVADLLAAAPGLRVLATSRERLRLSAEHAYPVPPLSLPAAGASVEVLERSDAAGLFAARAAAVDPGFRLEEGNAAAVAEICFALEGLPLALELAAARTALLPPEELARRLTRRLPLLDEGARDLPHRQRTLRAAIEWSYELLDDEERRLFRALAVFAGGCTIEAAESVCDASLSGLTSLVEKSLARRIAEGETRLAMLETIREYASERLEEAQDESSALRRRHAAYFLDLAERSESALTAGGEQGAWIARIEREHDNLRGVLAWCAEAHEAEVELRLVSALRHFWRVRGYLGEARSAVEAALAHGPDAPPLLRAEALAAGEIFAYRQGDLEATERFCLEALTLFEQVPEPLGIARMAGELGNVAYSRGEYREALERYEEATRQLRVIGDDVRLAVVLANMGSVANMLGDLDSSAALTGEAVELSRKANDNDGLAIALHNLARTELRRGHEPRAGELMREALAIAIELGYRELVAYCLAGIAELTAAEDPRRAARVLGTSDALFEELGVPMGDEEREGYERTVERLGVELGAEAFTALRAEGRALSAEEASREALTPR